MVWDDNNGIITAGRENLGGFEGQILEAGEHTADRTYKRGLIISITHTFATLVANMIWRHSMKTLYLASRCGIVRCARGSPVTGGSVREGRGLQGRFPSTKRHPSGTMSIR